MKNGETEKINSALVIIAGGAQSGQIGQLAGIGNGLGLLEKPIPVEPRLDIGSLRDELDSKESIRL